MVVRARAALAPFASVGVAAVILIVVTLGIYALQLRLVDPFKAAGGRH